MPIRAARAIFKNLLTSARGLKQAIGAIGLLTIHASFFGFFITPRQIAYRSFKANDNQKNAHRFNASGRNPGRDSQWESS